MRYFFHVFDGSELHSDDNGNDLDNLESAKRMAKKISNELKNGGPFSQSSVVIVADVDDHILFECGGDSSDNHRNS